MYESLTEQLAMNAESAPLAEHGIITFDGLLEWGGDGRAPIEMHAGIITLARRARLELLCGMRQHRGESI